jgi:hypothetical protein
VADDIEIQFVPRRGVLSLSCDDEAFARIRDAVIAAANRDAAGIGGAPTEVRVIIVEANPPAVKPISLASDTVALLGCSLLASGLLFVFAVGVSTIAGWLR